MPLAPFPEAFADLIEAKVPPTLMPCPAFPEAFVDWILADAAKSAKGRDQREKRKRQES